MSPVASDVIVKLLGFTVLMIFAPIGSYYASLNNVYGGEKENMRVLGVEDN